MNAPTPTKTLVSCFCGLLFFALTATPALAALIAPNGSERATTGAGNKIVTFAGKTHVVWQKSAKLGYYNKIRSLDHATGEWSKEFPLNQGVDNHARPVITVDRDGHLHVVLSGHNTIMSYRRSLRPNDASEWGPVEDAGAGTYPSIACGRDGSVFMAARAKGQHGADFIARSPDGKWSDPVRLVARAREFSGYAGFSTGLTVDRQGTLHFICDIYEGKSGKHQALCYMRSRDGGRTWRTAAGKPVKIPARPEDMDLLLDDSTPRLKVVTWPWINSRGNIVADTKGRPYVAYVSHIERPGAVILATADQDGAWTQRNVTAAESAFPDMRPMGVSVALSMDSADTLHLLLELTPLDDGWTQGKPLRDAVFREEPVKRLVLLSSRDQGESFEVKTIVKPGAMFNMATMERPTGVNDPGAGRTPSIIFFDGTCRYPKRGEVINNNVFFVAPK